VVARDDDPDERTQEGAPVFGDTLEAPRGSDNDQTKVRAHSLDTSVSSSLVSGLSQFEEVTNELAPRGRGAPEPKTVLARLDELGGDAFFASQPSTLGDDSEESSAESSAERSVFGSVDDGVALSDTTGPHDVHDAADPFVMAMTLPSLERALAPSAPMAPAMRPAASPTPPAEPSPRAPPMPPMPPPTSPMLPIEPSPPLAWPPSSLPPPPPTSRVFGEPRTASTTTKAPERIIALGVLDPALPPAGAPLATPRAERPRRHTNPDDDDRGSTPPPKGPPAVWNEGTAGLSRRALWVALVVSVGLLTAVVLGRDRGRFIGGGVDPVLAQTLSERAQATIAARVRADVAPAVGAIARSVGCDAVMVVRDTIADAWMLPNQTVVVSDALLRRLSSDAQLAAVVAHLVAHHRLGHVGGLSEQLDGPAVVAAVRAPAIGDEGPVHEEAAALLTTAGFGPRALVTAHAALVNSPWTQRHQGPAATFGVGAPEGRRDEEAYDREIRARVDPTVR
jgi:hypothetical protein